MKLGKAIFLCAWTSLLAASPASAQSIVGAWTAGDTTVEGASVLVFLANGSYFQIQNAKASEAPHGFPGFERGTYTLESGDRRIGSHYRAGSQRRQRALGSERGRRPHAYRLG